MLIISVVIIVHKKFVQTVNSVTFHSDCVKMWEDFAPNFDDKRTACFFPPGNFRPKNTTVVPHPTYFSLFLRLKIKLKSRNFDTTEVVEAELLAVLNTLTEHYFQGAIRYGRSAGNSAYARKGTTSRVMVSSRPKVSF
jgi:hypothetical protein